MARKLMTHYVEKPWGVTELPDVFDTVSDGKIGEIWFQDTGDNGCQNAHSTLAVKAPNDIAPLLVKYIFTSERLSIQVHPNDSQAQQYGLTGGKEEIWYILDCAPGAVIGIGLTQPLNADQLRAAALDGSLENLIDWRPVKPGDCYFIPAGTIHAIGADIALVEVQQNIDITYRLYDYGRPRELHLDQAVAVSRMTAYDQQIVHAPLGRQARLACPRFAPFWVDLIAAETVADIAWPPESATAVQIWLIPLDGTGTVDGHKWSKGECWLIDAQTAITLDTPSSFLMAGIASHAGRMGEG